jgi:hypothetical protein
MFIILAINLIPMCGSVVCLPRCIYNDRYVEESICKHFHQCGKLIHYKYFYPLGGIVLTIL